MSTKSTIFRVSLLSVICLMVILPLSKCKGFGSPQYNITVIFQEGVEGTPAPGTETHDELIGIDYEYTPIDGESPVGVLVNGSRWSASGTFMMYTDLTVIVYLIDIRGTWDITFSYDDYTTDNLEFQLTFTGDSLVGGTFSDSRGYSGTWEIVDNVLAVSYNDWADYIMEGDVSSMRGNWAGEDRVGSWTSSFVE